MTHEEIVREADRIVQNKTEAWNCIFQYLEDKEHLKLTNPKVYKDVTNSCWYIATDESAELITYPFGFLGVEYLNQLASLSSLEHFVSYEKRASNSNPDDVNPLFDKSHRFFLWADSETSSPEQNLETLYNERGWIWEYIKEDIEALLEVLKIYIDANSNNNLKYIPTFYDYLRRLVLKVWLLQRHASSFSNSSEDTNDYLAEIEEMINDNDYLQGLTSWIFRYIGYENIVVSDISTPCKVYVVSNLLFLVVEDIAMLLAGRSEFQFDFCNDCGSMYVSTHGNRKYCPACEYADKLNPTARRKKNEARYLHKTIIDYINNVLTDDSEAFRNESNYYWAIVQGKKPKTAREHWYTSAIKTEEDYMNWLRRKKEDLKAQKNN